jgi:chemotaxis protein MotB
LSADRANASRRELLAGGLPDERVLRVQGLAASVPFDKADPASPANRRISIIVMNREAEDRFFGKGLEPPDAETAAQDQAGVEPPLPQVRPRIADNPSRP